MTHPVEPHEIEAAGNGDDGPKFKLHHLIGMLLGLAAFIGIVIGALL